MASCGHNDSWVLHLDAYAPLHEVSFTNYPRFLSWESLLSLQKNLPFEVFLFLFLSLSSFFLSLWARGGGTFNLPIYYFFSAFIFSCSRFLPIKDNMRSIFIMLSDLFSTFVISVVSNTSRPCYCLIKYIFVHKRRDGIAVINTKQHFMCLVWQWWNKFWMYTFSAFSE